MMKIAGGRCATSKLRSLNPEAIAPLAAAFNDGGNLMASFTAKLSPSSPGTNATSASVSRME